MSRRHTLFFGFILLFFASLACNAFAPTATEPGLDLPPPSVVELTSSPQATVIDGLAPTATLPNGTAIVNSGSDPTVRVLVDLNIRKGPGVQYDRVGFLLANQTAGILGRDPVSGWWKIVCPPSIDVVTECWLSGGAQYSTAVNAENVPVAAVPPTPTPEPSVTPTPSSLPDTGVNSASTPGFIVFTSSEGLWLSQFDSSQNPPIATTPERLSTDSQIGFVKVSPNGQRVAYISEQSGGGQLKVVNSSGGSSSILIDAQDLDENTADTLAPVIANVTWLSDNDTILFNTQLNNLTGPGSVSQEDLWSVSATTGAVTQLFSFNQFAGTIAAAGSIIIGGSSESMMRTNLDGDGPETVVSFPVVPTFSEFIFYPQAHWVNGGEAAFVAIPDIDDSAEESNTFTVWQIPPVGAAIRGSKLPGNPLFQPVLWSPTGDRLLFVDVVSIDNTSILTIADADGQNLLIYSSDSLIRPFAWNDSGQAFLYAGSDYYAVGSINSSPIQFIFSGGLLDMQWLNESQFITAVGSRGSWGLVANNLSGETNNLITADVDFVVFDLWSP